MKEGEKMIKRYTISEKAERQYRSGAKHVSGITYLALECKISSLIYASRDRYYYSDTDCTVAFGTCLITFSLDEVIDIRWSKKDHKCRVSDTESMALMKAYQYFGLTSNGVRFKEDFYK